MFEGGLLEYTVRVVLHKKEVRTPRTGVPIQSSNGVSRHVDVV